MSAINMYNTKYNIEINTYPKVFTYKQRMCSNVMATAINK